MMPNYIDEKERKYFEFFGEPALIAHGIVMTPHVDVYIFPTMEEAGYQEYMMITKLQER